MKKRTLSQAIMATTMVITTITRPVEAALTLGSTQGYEASLSGSLPVFLVISEHDATPTTQAEQAARIQSGFNPASLNLHIKAPAVDGLTVSAHLQYNSHLQGAGQQNSGLLESRIAEIHIDGAFHKITPALTVVAEIQQYRSQAQADYQAYIMGIQFDF